MKSEYLDMFDEYFSGKFNDQEKADFEARLNQDQKMDAAFQEYRDLRNGIDFSIMKTLKQELQELEATLPEVVLERDPIAMVTPGNKNRQLFYRAAAIVMLLAVSTTILLWLQQPTSSQDLFSQHFKPYENEFVSAQRGDDIAADPLVQAFMAYDAADYSAAIAGFETILGLESKKDQHTMVLFYLGSAQLAQGRSDEAIDTFERFLDVSQDSVVEGRWYLALSYLNEERVEDARKQLEELKNSRYEKEAQKILKKIK